MIHASSASVLAIIVTLGTALGGLAACEKTDHETIDKWTRTQKGPEKLKKAFTDESLDIELSAHAGANLFKKNMDKDVSAGFETMSPGRRTQMAAKLAPKLWEVARVEKELDLPKGEQISAKDALFMIRKYADPAGTQAIDNYLIDWYAVPSYEGRANGGGVIGSKILRTIGAPAAKKLISVVNGVVASPKNKIGDELMLALAVTGSPDAVKYLLDIAKMDRPDKTVAERATNALHLAYVQPEGLFEVTPPDALEPNLGQIAGLVKDERVPPHAANNAIDLIRAIGAPKCVAPLLEMVGYPHRDDAFTYMAVQNGLVCGGSKAISDLVRAMPEGNYERAKVVDAIVGTIVKLNPKTEVLTALRGLLDDKKVVARWIAIEALGELKSAEDASRVAALGSQGAKLGGFWGDQSGLDASARKADPTLGARAKEVADKLRKP